MDPPETNVDATPLIRRRISSSPSQSSRINLSLFKLIPAPGDGFVIQMTYNGQEKQFSFEEISAFIFRRIARSRLSVDKHAVFNVPDCFSESQRKATANAGVVAGTIAAAIGLVLDKHGARTTTTKNVLVYDLGGGRLNVLLMAIDAGKFRVKSVAGDPRLGGEDFTNRLLNHLAAGFKSKHKIDLSGCGRIGALFRLRAASDRAKLALSRDLETTIHIDSLCEGIDFYAAITRDTFEKLNMDLFKQGVNPLIDNCLRDGKINKNQVGYVVLMGGSSKIPKNATTVTRLLWRGGAPRRL